LNTAAHPERINIFLYVDDDDPTCQDYKKVVSNLATQYSPSAISLIFAPSVGVPKTASILFDATTADVFLTSNDDQIFIDPNWDTRLDIEIDKYPDNIFCTWFNDKWESNNFCTFPILSRQWI
jgi:glycosyl transferase/beta-hydroxylase protein BlmF